MGGLPPEVWGGEEHLEIFRFVGSEEATETGKGEGSRCFGKEQAWENRKGVKGTGVLITAVCPTFSVSSISNGLCWVKETLFQVCLCVYGGLTASNWSWIMDHRRSRTCGASKRSERRSVHVSVQLLVGVKPDYQ